MSYNQDSQWGKYRFVEPFDTYDPHKNRIAGGPPSSINSGPSPISLSSYNGFQDADIRPLNDEANPVRLQESHSPFRYQLLIRWWLPEILSSLFSIASLIALIVVLRVYDGRSLDDQRLPHWLTLNGLVAVIATLNRVALVAPVEAAMSQEVWLWFSSAKQNSKIRSRLVDLEISDSASRGAWGSFVFLWRGGGVGRWLSYIGAVVVIVSLAFGAFTQQLITYVTFPLPATSEFTPGNVQNSYTWNNYTGNPAEGAFSIPLNLKAAIYNGMLTEGIAPLTVPCETGNCTFPTTPSIAVCGECNDVKFTTSCNATICQHTFPSGTIFNFSNWEQASFGLGFQVVSRLPKFNSTSHRLDIIEFDVFGAPYDHFASPWPISTSTSSICALWMCVNAIDVTTNSGSQSQTTAATFSHMDNIVLPDGYSNSLLFNFSTPPGELNPTPGAAYTVGVFPMTALSEFFAPIVNGTIYLNLESQSPSSDFVQAIWNGTSDAGLGRWINNLALSMSNVVRTSAPATHPLYNGIAYQQGIQVRWLWLTLPATMVALSLLVLVMVIVETERARVQAWKGSPLAYLLTDLDGGIKAEVGGRDVGAFKGVERKVGRKRVVLDSQSSGRLIFRGVGVEGKVGAGEF